MPASAFSWQSRVSPLARLGWALTALLIVYASLAPWSGWRDLGVSPWAYLTAPLPRWHTRFDLVVNVLAYLPFGALGMLALHPRLRGAAAWLLVCALGALLSASLEALQTYLPTRVPATLDLATNALGTALGAAIMLPLTATLIDRGRLAQLRASWFERDASAVLVLLLLWPLAQIAPSALLFGNGEIHEPLAALAGVPLTTWQAGWTAGHFMLAEAVVVTAAVLGAGLALSSVMTPAAPRALLLLALLVAALGARTLAYAVKLGPEHALHWMSPSAITGGVLAALALLVAASGSRRRHAALAMIAMLVLLITVNATPENPYHQAWIGQFRAGRLLHANAAADGLATLWPFALLGVLLVRALLRRGRPPTVPR
jgi:VanZ family protein